MEGLRLFSEKEMTGHKLFQEMKMTELQLFSEKRLRGAILFWGLEMSHFPLCRTMNFAPSLMIVIFIQTCDERFVVGGDEFSLFQVH